MEWNKVIYDDCMNEVNGLPSLEDNCVDICFFDPPYNANKNYGIYKDNLPQKKYLKNMQKIMKECLRISKKGCGVYVDSYRFKIWWNQIFSEAEPIIIWKKSPGFANKYNLYSSYHVILTNIKCIKNSPNLWSDLHPVSDGYWWRKTGDYVSENHPAQTSYEIVEKFLSLTTKESVLDPFLGTGTTFEVCIKLGLQFIGYEINHKYDYDIQKRVKNCKKEPKKIVLDKFMKGDF